jgi:hypothetical protein
VDGRCGKKEGAFKGRGAGGGLAAAAAAEYRGEERLGWAS